MHEFPLDITQYKFIHMIGQGSTARVWVAKCLANNRTVAIKEIDLELHEIKIDQLRSEVFFWSTTTHPNVVKYFDSFTSGPKIFLLMEYMNYGSVFDLMKTRKLENEVYIATILKEILKALASIHESKQLHRDIKSGNVLLNDQGEVKLADFGIAANLLEEGQRKRARYTVIGTPAFMAPEVLNDQGGYTEKADIWSLGITAYEMATGGTPYSRLNPLEIIMKVTRDPPPKLPDSFSSPFKQFVKDCLNSNPSQRPTAKELLDHKFLKIAKNSEILTYLNGIPSLHERIKNETSPEIFSTQKTDWNFKFDEEPDKLISLGLEVSDLKNRLSEVLQQQTLMKNLLVQMLERFPKKSKHSMTHHHNPPH